jgi:hypothetical protein
MESDSRGSDARAAGVWHRRPKSPVRLIASLSLWAFVLLLAASATRGEVRVKVIPRGAGSSLEEAGSRLEAVVEALGGEVEFGPDKERFYLVVADEEWFGLLRNKLITFAPCVLERCTGWPSECKARPVGVRLEVAAGAEVGELVSLIQGVGGEVGGTSAISASGVVPVGALAGLEGSPAVGSLELRQPCLNPLELDFIGQPLLREMYLGEAQRFAAHATWSNDPLPGDPDAVLDRLGQPSQIATDSGGFWFFERSNLELVVKVLDGCAVNDYYWVFVSGLTDRAVRLVLTDLVGGATWTRENELGVPVEPAIDVEALPCDG